VCVDASGTSSAGRWFTIGGDLGAVPDALTQPSLAAGPARVGWLLHPADYTVASQTREVTVMNLSARDQIKGSSRVQKGQTTGMSVSTSASAVIVTSSVSNEAIDDMALKLAMMHSPSWKLRHAEL
jgi:molybdopterin-binding protein